MPKKYRRRSTVGTIEKRRNKYRVRYTDKDKRRYDMSGFATFEDADQYLLDLQLGALRPSRATEWAAYWERGILPTLDGLEAKTRHEYIRQWEHDLEPHIGCSRVGETTWRNVQDVIDKLPTESVQRHAFALLRKCCNIAVRDGILAVNPCDRSIRFKKGKKMKKNIPDAAGLLLMLDCITGTKYEPILLLMLGCGLRMEEAMALDWEDIGDYEAYGTSYVSVDVHRTMVMVGSKAVEKDTTKTEASTRTILVGAPFSDRLRSLRSAGPIVPNRSGGRTSPSTVSHNWRQWCSRNGLEYTAMGQMRSVYCTLAREAADSSLVSIVMGHTDGTTGGRNYQQATLRGAAIVADLYGESLEAARPEYERRKKEREKAMRAKKRAAK